MARTGRPTKLTSELTAEIVKYIRLGSYIEVACQAVGITKETYYDWLTKAEAGSKAHQQFSYAIKKAQAEAELRLLADIEANGDQWQRQAWKLERRFNDRWGRKDKIDATVTVNPLEELVKRFGETGETP